MTSTEQAVSADVFAGRIVRTLNDGFTTLMMSLGHRTGLFDTMAVLPPSTSTQIAAAAELNERYVREWLAAMTTARIVALDAATSTYTLPIEYAAVLTRAAGSDNLASFAQFLPLLAAVEDTVLNAFRSGGGVRSEAFRGLHEAMAETRRHSLDEDSIASLLALVPGLREKLESGADVLDIGCGRGHLMNVLAKLFPGSLFRGYDVSREAIVAAREEAERWGLRNAGFEVIDVAEFHEPASYDLITAFDTIHQQAFPTRVLRNIAVALRPDGVFLMQDVAASSQLHRNVDHPFATMLYAMSCMHSMTVSLAQDGEGLGTMWGEERARQKLWDAGLKRLRFERLETDRINYYCIARK